MEIKEQDFNEEPSFSISIDVLGQGVKFGYSKKEVPTMQLLGALEYVKQVIMLEQIKKNKKAAKKHNLKSQENNTGE